MAHEKAKVYFDGSHYIATSPKTRASVPERAAITETIMTKRERLLKRPIKAQRPRKGRNDLLRLSRN